MLHFLFAVGFPLSSYESAAQMVRTMGGLRAWNAVEPQSDNLELPAAQYFTQKLDHLNASQTRTWKQAYYVNDRWWSGRGPVFLCVGGEGPALTGAVVVSSEHCNIAVEALQKFGALMVALEHRYYGCHNASACPYTQADPEPLAWLSSRQALADIQTFHAHISRTYRLTTSRWVTFGGSYPGMLASWARLLYPSLIFASVSSSAPVHAKLDMPEYNALVGRAYTLPSVGGSAPCNATISEGHAKIGEMLRSAAGRAKLVATFPTLRGLPVGWLASPANQVAFAASGVASFPAQSNDPACTERACSVGKICDLLDAAPGTPADKLAALAREQMDSGVLTHAANAANSSHAALPTALPAALPAGRARASLDYWGWQTCTEFGFYQTCEAGSGCPFTQGLFTLREALAFCADDYGIEPPAVAVAVEATNARYGGLRPGAVFPPSAASRILYVNGDVDPWSSLAILASPGPGLRVMPNVSGASHHFWTHPSQPMSDQRTVVHARAAIVATLQEWLGQ